MNRFFIKPQSWLSCAGLVLCCSLSAPALAFQEPEQAATQTQQSFARDPISQLSLTPGQRQKIRALNEENREQRMRINRQLREAQFSLEQALDVDSPSEELVEERIRALADAQAAQIRMRVSQELKIRSVLTPEQVRIWLDQRAHRRNLRRRSNDPNFPEAQRTSPNQRNTLAPIFQQRRRARP